MKRALITGITGQDGAYLADFLIEKGYQVHGIKRRSSLFNTQRIDHIYNDPHDSDKKLILHYGDLTDGLNITRIIKEVQPDEIYNLGAMSHVKVSFEEPEYTANVDGIGVLRILEAVRLLDLGNKTRIYQASTSEMYGKVTQTPQNELTPFHPRSPYGIAKLFAHWTIVNYREAYSFFAVNGILFNHESPVRGETFVTRKITRAVADIYYNKQKKLYLGNLNSMRDWGHARDYVQAMWLMLQADKPEDYVIATGNSLSVRDFTIRAFKEVDIELEFSGSGSVEKGLVISAPSNLSHIKLGDVLVEVDVNYNRPTEVDSLIGDASKAKRNLGWEPTCTVDGLIKEMMKAEMKKSLTFLELNSKIFIAGINGMVGSAIKRNLTTAGYKNIIGPTSTELDLRDQKHTQDFFNQEKPEYVFLSAAKVGGILANDTFRADFLYDNLQIQSNVIHSAYLYNVKKLLFLGSSCIYPKMANQPLKEEYLLSGDLESTNEAYAIAKIAGIKMCEAYRDQYDCNFISVMPTNLYGPHDNYDLKNSHVLPALLKKIHDAKVAQKDSVDVWGTGSPLREFLHVDDLAEACVFLTKNYHEKQFLNVGSGEEISIKNLAELIKKIVGFEGGFQYDHSKPDGTPRKFLDSSKINQLGWKPTISLQQGIADLYKKYF